MGSIKDRIKNKTEQYVIEDQFVLISGRETMGVILAFNNFGI